MPDLGTEDHIYKRKATKMTTPGVGGVGVCSGLLKQKVAGSNPVVTNPERSVLRAQSLN